MQEHWLYSSERKMVDDLLPSADYVIKCVDDLEPIPQTHWTRGTAGVATFWPKSLSKYIIPLPDGGDRVLAIQIETNTRTLVVINTYMPTSGTLTNIDYNEVLDEVFEIMSKYSDSLLIWTGDINASSSRSPPSRNDVKLLAFLRGNKLEISPATPQKPTYFHFTGDITSTIDYFIVPIEQPNIISSIDVDERNHINTSCHDPITAILLLTLRTESETKPADSAVTLHRRTRWDKVDKDEYYDLLQDRATRLMSDITQDTPVEVIIRRLETILYDSSVDSSPGVVVKPRKKTRFPWSAELVPLMKQSKQAYAAWKGGGRPSDHNHELCVNRKHAKKQLRQAQVRLAARAREASITKILEANEADQELFYKLIRCQRSEQVSRAAPSIEFHDQEGTLLEGDRWAQYFEDLATPKSSSTFDEFYKQSVDLQRCLLRDTLRNSAGNTHPVDSKRVQTLITQLKSKKACDGNGIMAEHIKLAPPIVTDIITLIMNRLLKQATLPDCFKVGIISPVHKKEKPISNPDSYRRITVTPLLGKLYEKELTSRIKEQIDDQQSPYQFGFREGASSNNAAAILTEIIMNSKDSKKPLLLMLMDASKAFDVVDHSSMLNHLAQRGVDGNLWCMIDEMYTRPTARVKWQGGLSRELLEQQGIRQGAISSTVLFNNRSVPLLQRLCKNPGSIKIGDIRLGAVMCADDLALLSDSRTGMQLLVNEAAADASRERLVFSSTKTIMVPMREDKLDPTRHIQLYDSTITEEQQGKHLGILRTSDGKNLKTIESRIQTARRTSYALMGAGLHGLNGLSPMVSLRILNTYVIPRLTFGLEALVLTTKEINLLETLYKKYLRAIQCLPESTASPAIYLLAGALPIEARIHTTMLTFVASMSRRQNSLERELLYRQLAMKDLGTNSWVMVIQSLLLRYQLPTLANLLQNPPEKITWKNTVQAAVNEHWFEQIKVEAEQKPSLGYLSMRNCKQNLVHPVWQLNQNSSIEVQKATIKTRLLVQRYPVYSNRISGKNFGKLCPLCSNAQETIHHFLLCCPALMAVRQPILDQIVNIIQSKCVTVDESSLVQTILDCDPAISIDLACDPAYLGLTRHLCYRLHHRRSILLEQSAPKPSRRFAYNL
jgi:hypothetical protein